MCGITGSLYLGSYGYTQAAVKIQYAMLLNSVIRGEDSTGILFGDLDPSKSAQYYKQAGPAPQVITKDALEQYLDTARWCITHTRAATLGKVDAESAHPFNHKTVSGVHNGTVASADTLFPEYKGLNDSDIIYQAIADAEDDDAVVEVLKAIDVGAYALVWYDSRLHALRFARNLARPLWFYKHEPFGWLWASEPGNIAASVARTETNKPLSYMNIKPWSLETDTLLTIPVNGDPASFKQFTPSYSYSYPYARHSRRTDASPFLNGYVDPYENGYDPYGVWDEFDKANGLDASNDTNGNKATDKPKVDPLDRNSVLGLHRVDVKTGNAIWTQPAWFNAFRIKAFNGLSNIFGPLGSDEVGMHTLLKDISESHSNWELEVGRKPDVYVNIQHIDWDKEELYGAVDIEEQSFPVVVSATHEFLAAVKDSMDKESYTLVIRMFLEGLSVYADGWIGLWGNVGEDVAEQFYYWTSSCDLELDELAAGSKDTHPALTIGGDDDWIDWSHWSN